MREKKKVIIKIAIVLSIIAIVSLACYGQKIAKLNEKVENELLLSRQELEQSKQQLAELEEELLEMDSDEYIEKMATKLGMVKEDTIVIKKKK